MIKILSKPWLLTLLAALAALLLTTGCSTDTHGKNGVPGTVVDRDSDTWTTGSKHHRTVHHDYDLTVKRADDGTEYSIDVGKGVYDHCYRGSKYPKCVGK